MKFIPLSMLLCFLFVQAKAQQFKIDTLQYQGSATNMINLVIMGDGYKQDELGNYAVDAKRFTDYFFKTEPFRQYANFFNVYAIHTVSEESGATHACTAEDCPHVDHGRTDLPADFNKFPKRITVPEAYPNTIFGSSFDNHGIHRLVIPQKSNVVEQVLKDHIPNYTQVIILVNSPFYGGSGGKFATATVNFDSNDIAVHEIGHSFAALADEYWAGNMYANEGPNRTQQADANAVPWRHWLGTNDVGVYAYGGKDSRAKWFRPHEFCKMQYLVAPFCSVCQEVFVETIHRKTNPIIAQSPQISTVEATEQKQVYAVKLAKPSPNTLRVSWLLNGKIIASHIDSISLNKGLLQLGKNTVQVEVSDTTGLVRNPAHKDHIYSTQWEIINKQDWVLDAPVSTWGDTLETCYNGYQALSVKLPQAGVQYNWYLQNDSSTVVHTGHNMVTGRLKADRVYTVQSVSGAKKSARTTIYVKVLPEIPSPGPVKVTHSKDKNAITLSIAADKDERYAYVWTREDGKPLYMWDVDAKKLEWIGRSNTAITVLKEEKPFKVLVQRMDKQNTCLSESAAVIVE